jgi:hypothetical protein
MSGARGIQISTDTFAAIWRDRRPGENSEEEILRRKFRVAGLAPALRDRSTPPELTGGYLDQRSGVLFREGLEIFRSYKNVPYRAKATSGRWLLLNDSKLYDSLNALSNALGASENSWRNWYYRDERGAEKLIDTMRDKTKISKRTR